MAATIKAFTIRFEHGGLSATLQLIAAAAKRQISSFKRLFQGQSDASVTNS